MTTGWDAFVAYARCDAELATDLYYRLSKHGRAFLDRMVVEPGRDWEEAIAEAMSSSRLIVMLLSARALETGFLQRQGVWLATRLHLADEYLRKLIPVHLDPALVRDARVVQPLRALSGIVTSPKEGLEGVVQQIEALLIGQSDETKSAAKPPSTNTNVNIILFVGSAPEVALRLALEREVNAIRKSLATAPFRDQFGLIHTWAVTPSDLIQNLLRYRPTIVHFSGHGSMSGKLALVDDQGLGTTLSTGSLASMFRALSEPPIRCVVMNGCYSQQQARPIIESVDCVDCVVGITHTVNDAAAVAFSAEFYAGLASGKNVQTAAKQAWAAARLMWRSEEDAFHLVTRQGVLADAIRFL